MTKKPSGSSIERLSWNEVRTRAARFSRAWAGASSEQADKQTFWNEFFEVFGLKRRSVATFEAPVVNLRGQYGFIDLFWEGVMLVEHKSRGQNLDAASSQAFSYIQDLHRQGQSDKAPQFVIVSDFVHFALYDLESVTSTAPERFVLDDFHEKVRLFAFLRGERPVKLNPEDPANTKAYGYMTTLHASLEAGGFPKQELDLFLVRILFCLFADDTGIFEPNAFQSYIENRTRPDGSDLGAQLNMLFDVLNTASESRQAQLDDDLKVLPYVNGDLFKDRLSFAAFNSDMRRALIECCNFHWARVSPAVFGSLFQGVMDKAKRRQSGGHYTSERDILKVVNSLFLDGLRLEFQLVKEDRSSRREARLRSFQHKLRSLRFLDPACGCGNFLIISYRELRRLELEVVRLLPTQRVLELKTLFSVDVDQFYGIEINKWPARIAQVAMWLMDHQMNQEASEAFGDAMVRFPLEHSPHIVCGNALRIDWRTVIEPSQCSYVLGNPPFVGSKLLDTEQRKDMGFVAGRVPGSGVLDYVTAWYFKAAEYIRDMRILVAFVSTNSITQGEQVGVLWNALYSDYGVKIHFAHRTFAWESEAQGKAHVLL